jgi:predicted enzyme related to lactoylglutathione lyase
VTGRDWAAWHRGYDEPDSTIARRLVAVQGRIRDAVTSRPAGPIRVVSMCAGEARDLVGALDGHPRRADVVGRLVELEPGLAGAALAAAAAVGLTGLEALVADAGCTDSYVGAVPADLVLACGIFGNLTDADIERAVAHLPSLCAPDAVVIWTRHRRPPDLAPVICHWLARSGFVLEWLSDPGESYGVGVHRFVGEPVELRPGKRIFTFGRTSRTDLGAGHRMSPMSGRVVHFEIPADNLERASAFYRQAFGWQLNAVPQMNYTLVSTTAVDESGAPTDPGAINGGMLPRGGPVTSPVITVEVDSVDRALAKVEELGGKTVLGRQPVGDMGFSAYVTDSEGNVVGLWENAS